MYGAWMMPNKLNLYVFKINKVLGRKMIDAVKALGMDAKWSKMFVKKVYG